MHCRERKRGDLTVRLTGMTCSADGGRRVEASLFVAGTGAEVQEPGGPAGEDQRVTSSQPGAPKVR